MNIFWWIITGVVFAIGVLHVISLARAWTIRRRVSRRQAEERTSASASSPHYIQPQREKEKQFAFAPAPPSPTSNSSTTVPRAQPGISTAYRAARALFHNYAYVRVFPLWIFSHSTAAEWWWTAAYTGITLGLTFWISRYNGIFDIANPMGYAVSTSS